MKLKDGDFLLFYLILYSILGWIYEVTIFYVKTGKVANKGFFIGPYCPKYGIGVIFALTAVRPFIHNPLLVMIISLVTAAAIEYISNWMMEGFFSRKQLFVNMRIYTLLVVLAGVAYFICIYYVHPFVADWAKRIPETYMMLFMLSIFSLFIWDCYFTLSKLRRLYYSDAIHIVRYQPKASAVLYAIGSGFGPAPVRYIHYSGIDIVHDADSANNKVDDYNGYDLFWICILASVAGYVIETIYCLIINGTLESRQGLLYGPFSQVYGIGAIAIVIFLSPLAKKSDNWLFVGGALLGGLFEYICSFIQEACFGTVSWEYSSYTFSIGGRTNLTYMLFWGVLGIWFMKLVYPWLLKIARIIPVHKMKLITIVTAVLLLVNSALSISAVYRWSERINGDAPSNAYEAFLDSLYNNDKMARIYPNMRFTQQEITR